MATWKKIITSGSNAELNDLTISGSLTNVAGNAYVLSSQTGSMITEWDGTINTTSQVTIDSSAGVSIDSTGTAANFTVASDADHEDLTISQTGANDSSVIITSAGTGADAVSIDATAGSMVIAPNLINGKTLTIGPSSATQMVFTPHGTPASEKISLINTSGTADDAIKIDAESGGLTLAAGDDSLHIDADGTDGDALNIDSAGGIDVDAAGAIAIDGTGAASDITLTTAHTAGVAFHLDANADAASEVQIDAGILDIDVTGAATLDAVGVAIGAGSGELDLTTTGTMDINSAGLDIDASGAITIDGTGAASDITFTTAHTAGVAFHLDANADAASEVQIDAGILDIDVTGAATLDAVGVAIGAGSGELDLTTTGTMDINSAGLDIDASGAITIDGTGAASDISIVTAHTAGVAFHLDANADAASEVQIDAGILDIDVTGTIDIDGGSSITIGGTDATSVVLGNSSAPVTITGDLTVNGTTTTIDTEQLSVSESMIFLASGSHASNVDAGILVQSGSVANSGSALYHDTTDRRWAVATSVSISSSHVTPDQYVTTVKTSTSPPSDSTDGTYGVGEMWIDTDTSDGDNNGNGVIYIRTA